VVQCLFFQVVAAVDAVHDLHGPVGIQVLGAVFDPAHEPGRFIGESDAEKGVEGEGGVADPGVTVVPITLASQLLRQAAGGAATMVPVVS
jgi:hypothetical protein